MKRSVFFFFFFFFGGGGGYRKLAVIWRRLLLRVDHSSRFHCTISNIIIIIVVLFSSQDDVPQPSHPRPPFEMNPLIAPLDTKLSQSKLLGQFFCDLGLRSFDWDRLGAERCNSRDWPRSSL